MSDFQRQYALDEFFGQWPRTRMAAMTLDECTPVGLRPHVLDRAKLNITGQHRV